MGSLDSLHIDDDKVIWRYVDFVKFASILNSQSFFHSRMDFLGDPFEGSVTNNDMDEKRRQWIEMSMDGGAPAGVYEHHDMAMSRDPRTEVYVSCWHESRHENVAMWKIYSDEKKGIAIKSTVGKLRTFLPDEGRVRRVKYLDYDNDRVLDYSPVYCKRSSFSYEREVRSAIPHRLDKGSQPAGIDVQVDLESFIDEIVLSPRMPSWVKSLIKDMVSRFGVNIPIRNSRIADEPVFHWYIGGDLE